MASFSSQFFSARTVQAVQEGLLIAQNISVGGATSGTFTIPISTVNPARAELEFVDHGHIVSETTNNDPWGFTAELQATQILITLYGGGPTLGLNQFRWRVTSRAGIRNVQRGAQVVAGGSGTSHVIPATFVDPSRAIIRINGTARSAGGANSIYYPEMYRITAVTTTSFTLFKLSTYQRIAWEATEEL